MKFSLEIGPKTDIDAVPALSDVYITMLPGGDYRETAEKASELVRKGFNPVPHFPARSMQDDNELKDNKLIINVIENPIIQSVQINGIKAKKIRILIRENIQIF